jgi:hypothetical protein
MAMAEEPAVTVELMATQQLFGSEYALEVERSAFGNLQAQSQKVARELIEKRSASLLTVEDAQIEFIQYVKATSDDMPASPPTPTGAPAPSSTI